MFVKSSDLDDPNDYINNALTERPTTGETIGKNFRAGFIEPFSATKDVENYFSQTPTENEYKKIIEALEYQNQNPNIGTFQYGANYLAGMIGYLLNPISITTGEIGGAIAAPLIKGTAKILPTTVNKFVRTPLVDILPQKVSSFLPRTINTKLGKKTLSTALLGEKGAKIFSNVAGATLPAAIEENYDSSTNSIHWGGVATSMGEMGGIGIGIGSIPFVFGLIGRRLSMPKLPGKTTKAAEKIKANLSEEEFNVGKETLNQEQIDKINKLAPERKANIKHIKWYEDYLKAKNDPHNSALLRDVEQRATEIAAEEGFKVDSVNHRVKVDLLTDDDMNNLKSAMHDQIMSRELTDDDRHALSEFIANGRLDTLSRDTKLQNGLKGYLEFMREKLEFRELKVSEFDKKIDEHLEKPIKENLYFSQKSLYKRMKQAGFESSHIKDLIVNIPKNIEKNIKISENINRLKKKIRSNPNNRQTLRRIEKLERNRPELLTPKEELIYLRKKLLENGLPKRLDFSKDYNRLVELAHFWKPAANLLERVHLERDYEKQAAFYRIIKTITDTADNNLNDLSNPQNVIDYLKNKVESQISEEIKTVPEINKELEQATSIPTDSKEIVEQQKENAAEVPESDVKEEFNEASERFDEFKKSEGIFKDLINCVLGRK